MTHLPAPNAESTRLADPCLDAERNQDEDLRARLRQRLLDFAWSFAVVAICAIGFAFTPAGAQATQTIEIRDSDTAIVRISATDQTRLRAEEGRLLDVIGDVFDADKNPGGRIVVLRDDEAGEFYLTPASAASQPIKLDVKTDRGTVGLVLTPVGMPGNTVTLRVTGGTHRPAPSDATARAATHQRSVKALVLAMATPEAAAALPKRRLPKGGETVSLWNEARFVLTAVYQAAGMEGEVYRLTNVSQAPMVLDEREFYRSGVLAVAIRRLQLAPGETTAVWIVRTPDRND